MSEMPPPWSDEGQGQWSTQAWPAPSQPAWGTPLWEPPRVVRESREGFAVASLVLGIIPVMAGLLGIIFGIVALTRVRRSGQPGKGMAIAGLICGSLWFLGIVAAIVFVGVTTPERAAAGGFTERGEISWADLQVGDCVERDPGAGAHQVTVTPCTTAHEVEVFDRFTSMSADIRITRARCLDSVDGYLGSPREASIPYAVNDLQRAADPVGGPAVCLLLAPDRGRVTRSLRSSWPWTPPGASPTAAPVRALTGDVSLDDLRLRDCVARIPDGTVTTLRVLPCRSKHVGEVFDVHALGKGGYPGRREVTRLALGRCRATLPRFAGTPPGVSGYYLNYYAPTRESWSAGDTRVICLLSDPDGHPLVGDAFHAGKNRA